MSTMKKAFITGGSGFIGTNLLQSLGDSGVETLNYDLKTSPPGLGAAHFVRGDVRAVDDLRRALKEFKPDTLVHLAARCDLRGRSLEAYNTNTLGVENVVRTIKDINSLERVVFTSTRYVHSNETKPERDDDYSPFTLYGASKVEGERIVRAGRLKTPWFIVRPTSIWGPWFGPPYRGFFDAVRRGIYLHPKREKIYKSFGYVGNTVYQYCRLLEAPIDTTNRRVFYCADYEPLEVRGWAESIRNAFGAPRVREIPLAAMRLLGRIGDMLQIAGVPNPPFTTFRLKNLRAQMVYDMTATEGVVGALPYTVDLGVTKCVAWMELHG